ncbi:uncharacterized protein LAESUDRAFT_813795 [Laetiporus sulphureus 93-53]|uniref:RING-type domain-containing protein n=1 Tax=Laetiporus sulphureus 93-53 TaxID=1314785 RepID=A0A165DHR7_9APHY|nr:uncharacterized protein LAESUDRAFT_813795 [Laetiporus sulphureus 93-53]KZT04906.1 hypothetical protein LAESUDRAFT_813795 [Laetiporus sulphureus 93-53]
MSSPSRALAAEQSSRLNVYNKRPRSDSEDTSDREDACRDAKRAMGVPQEKLEAREKEKKKKRSKKRKHRKVSITQPPPGDESAGRSQAPPHIPQQEQPSSNIPTSVGIMAEETRDLLQKLPVIIERPCGSTSRSRQSSAGPSSVMARTGNLLPSEATPMMPPILDKGKGKALPEPESKIGQPAASSDASEVVILTTQLAAHEEILNKHTTLLSVLQQSLICQICLDPMHRPYALAPCGHVACHSCLVAWFKAAPPNAPPEEVPSPLRRRKTCPHCRALIIERPVEVWAVKEMVSALFKSGLSDPPLNPPAPADDASNANVDPWEGIFRKPPAPPRVHGGNHPLFFPDPPPPAVLHQVLGIYDDEDGGVYRCVDCLHEIWDGVCSECGREYPGQGPAPFEESDYEEEPWRVGMDEAEGDVDDYSSSDEDYLGMHPFADVLWNALGMGEHGNDTEDDEEDDEEDRIREIDSEDGHVGEDEDAYESSFIDDGDDEGARRSASVQWIPPLPDVDDAGDADDSDDESAVGPLPRSMRGRAVGPVVVSSEDEDDDEDENDSIVGGICARLRHHPRILSDDEEEEEDYSGDDSIGLAAEVAARERNLYGDDGSTSRGSFHWRRPAGDDVYVYDDHHQDESAIEWSDDGDVGYRDDTDGASVYSSPNSYSEDDGGFDDGGWDSEFYD